jgi:DNA polymerase III epsilon subunit-like protein
MQQFADWVSANVAANETPVFVAFNAPFDWMFIAFYFSRHLGRNPFGHKALDVKAYYMGQHNTSWQRTNFENVSRHFGMDGKLPHNALGDAVIQADIFRAMLAEQEQRPERNER